MESLKEAWPEILFGLLGFVIVLSSIAVVMTQNIVRCATWLLLALCATAGMFFLLGAEFVGAVQLLIYVGGTLVLVIFGVMLTAQGPFVRMTPRGGEWIIAAVVAFALSILLYASVKNSHWTLRGGDETASATSSTTQLGLGFLSMASWGQGQVPGDPGGIGYLLPFEIVSVHLLVVLIGAAYLARAKRRRRAGS